MHSILVLIGDPVYREKVCAEIVRGVQCPIYAASDFPAALSLLQAEKPTILMLTSEFASVLGTPVGEIVADFAPETAILFLTAPSLAASPAATP